MSTPAPTRPWLQRSQKGDTEAKGYCTDRGVIPEPPVDSKQSVHPPEAPTCALNEKPLTLPNFV